MLYEPLVMAPQNVTFLCVLTEYALLHSILSLNETHIAQGTDCLALYDLIFLVGGSRKTRQLQGKTVIRSIFSFFNLKVVVAILQQSVHFQEK